MRLQRDSYAPKSCAFDAANVQFLRAHLCKSHPVLQQADTRAWLEGIYYTVLNKDVTGRGLIGNVPMLQHIAVLLLETAGRTLSADAAAKTLADRGCKTDVKTVDKYMRVLTQSGLFYEAKCLDIRTRKVLPRLSQYYAVDPALSRAVLGGKEPDAGDVLENVICLELIRRGYDVFAGRQGVYETGFAAQRPDETLYVWAAVSVRTTEVLQRVLKSLRVVKDSHRKLLLTLDNNPAADCDGIVCLNALDWLMGR